MPKKLLEPLSSQNKLSSPNKRLHETRGRKRKSIDPEAFLPQPAQKSKKETHRSSISLRSKSPCNPKNPTDAAVKRFYPITSEKNYTTDEVEFMNALSEFKRVSGRLFPTCSEILTVLRGLGYEKIGLCPVESSLPDAAEDLESTASHLTCP